jgi:AcrR family transcriptional regulator
MAEQPRKEHLVAVAAGLFNEMGYHQCGIDEIMRLSGVSKTTLYKYFPSKEHLVLEVLQRRSKALLEQMRRRIEARRELEPRAPAHTRIVEILEIIDEWIGSGSFFGCNFVRAAAEYSDPRDPIRVHAASYKASMRDIVAELLCELPAGRRESVAEQIMVVIDGAITTAQVRRRSDVIESARQIVAAILSQELSLSSAPARGRRGKKSKR